MRLDFGKSLRAKHSWGPCMQQGFVLVQPQTAPVHSEVAPVQDTLRAHLLGNPPSTFAPSCGHFSTFLVHLTDFPRRQLLILRKLERLRLPEVSCWKTLLGTFDAAGKILHRFSGSTRCYPCPCLGTFRRGKWLLENRPRLQERSWIFLWGHILYTPTPPPLKTPF